MNVASEKGYTKPHGSFLQFTSIGINLIILCFQEALSNMCLRWLFRCYDFTVHINGINVNFFVFVNIFTLHLVVVNVSLSLSREHKAHVLLAETRDQTG